MALPQDIRPVNSELMDAITPGVGCGLDSQPG